MKLSREQEFAAMLHYSVAALQAFIMSESTRMGPKAPHEILIDPVIREAVRYGARMVEALKKHGEQAPPV